MQGGEHQRQIVPHLARYEKIAPNVFTAFDTHLFGRTRVGQEKTWTRRCLLGRMDEKPIHAPDELRLDAAYRPADHELSLWVGQEDHRL